ncbi:unnamed protein product [Mytilus coruscus]|uniref:C-type lectin domain-containing protein n=1 Tax=Mytilus coruscus TaxID=42192 RepID=A0A6J8CUV1_MYTCO|nr:unnamed protein product [Mytilus coruscus]
MSWVSAATWCKMKSGSLVSLDSQPAILMVEWYKDNDWSAQWTSHAWTGLYSFGVNTGYWQGTCNSLDFSYWAPAQTYSSSSPCTYMASSDLRWFYDDCTSQHHVVCQVPNASILQEIAPIASLDISTLVENCIETPTRYLSTPPPETSQYQLLTTGTAKNYKSSYVATIESKDTTKSDTTINIVDKTTTALSINKMTSETTTTNMENTESLVTLKNGNTTRTSQNSLKTEQPITATFLSTDKLNKFITLSVITSEYYSTKETVISTSETVSNTGIVASSDNNSEMYSLSPSSENCLCPCDFVSKNITAEMLQSRIEELKRILTVDKTSLSSFIRKYNSAKDERPSSKAIGSMGILLLTLTICFIVLIDLSTFCQYIQCKHLKRK